MGGTIVLLFVGAALLAAVDLWAVQARAAGSLLDVVGVGHEVVVPAEEAVDPPDLGAGSRGGRAAEAHGPFIRLDPPEPRRGEPAAAVVGLVVGALLVAAAIWAPVPTAVKGLVLAFVLVAASTLSALTWWSPRAPLDVTTVIVDWRTSAVGPMIAVAFAFALELYPLPGNIVVKTVWAWLGVVGTAAFSILRLAVVAAAFDAFGHAAFLPLFYVAGVFWDVVPGLGVLAMANAALGTASPRLRIGRR